VRYYCGYDTWLIKMWIVLAAGIVAVTLNLLLPQEAQGEEEVEEQDAIEVEEIHHGSDDDVKRADRV
jgi:hypothetical protein